ncbi:transposase [Endozoicomonas atrinae]|uniref:transposase n=1 Tax=Endozoicomonas atrinae TaxID=1333660 RepID=UPI003B00830C
MNIGRISDLISNETCFEMIRENRWPDGIVRCPHCDSENIKKNGHDNVQVDCQHYYCKSCKRYFDLSFTTPIDIFLKPVVKGLIRYSGILFCHLFNTSSKA